MIGHSDTFVGVPYYCGICGKRSVCQHLGGFRKSKITCENAHVLEPSSRGRKMKNLLRRRSNCPISITLEMLGDSWSLLVVRDLLFTGATRFNEFLGGEEKIATNILSDRLQRLERAGIIEKLSDPDDGRRHIYRLTEKGIDLAPVLIEMVLWASRYEETAAPDAVVRAMRKNPLGFIANLRAQWEITNGTKLPVTPGDRK